MHRPAAGHNAAHADRHARVAPVTAMSCRIYYISSRDLPRQSQWFSRELLDAVSDDAVSSGSIGPSYPRRAGRTSPDIVPSVEKTPARRGIDRGRDGAAPPLPTRVSKAELHHLYLPQKITHR